MYTTTFFRNKRFTKLLPALIVVLFCSTFLAVSPEEKVDPAKDPNPILLVHGLGMDSGGWGKLPEILKSRGFKVYVLDFNDWEWLPNADDPKKLINDLCVVLSRQLEQIVIETGRLKSDIIAHSYGGIIVRAYIAGWGGAVEAASEYNEDIRKVIYLATPHFGTDFSVSKRKQLVNNTDYSVFKNAGQINNSLSFGSQELLDLNRFFLENERNLHIDELTVSSEKDVLVRRYSANLDSVIQFSKSNVSKDAKPESKHIFLKQYTHVNSPVLGNQGPSILEIYDAHHPVVELATSFFNDTNKWKSIGSRAPAKSGFVAIEFANASGFNPSRVRKSAIKLKYIKENGKKNKIKLLKNKTTDVFYADKVTSGIYELTLPLNSGNKTFKFEINVAESSGTVLRFDPDNPPPDPDDPDNGGGGDGGGDEDKIPDAVNSTETLKQFVKARYNDEANTYMSPVQFLNLVAQVRDDLAFTYSDIERVNDQGGRFGYTAPDEEHIDAVYIVSINQVVDFVSSSSSGGILLEKLHWIDVLPPW